MRHFSLFPFVTLTMRKIAILVDLTTSKEFALFRKGEDEVSIGKSKHIRIVREKASFFKMRYLIKAEETRFGTGLMRRKAGWKRPIDVTGEGRELKHEDRILLGFHSNNPHTLEFRLL